MIVETLGCSWSLKGGPLEIAEARFFTGRMPFLSPDQQCHCQITVWVMSLREWNYVGSTLVCRRDNA